MISGMSSFLLRQFARAVWLLWLVQGVQEGPWERRCRLLACREGWELRLRTDDLGWRWGTVLITGTGFSATFEAEDRDDPHPASPRVTLYWSERLRRPEEAYESLWRAWALDASGGKGTSPEEFDLRALVFGLC